MASTNQFIYISFLVLLTVFLRVFGKIVDRKDAICHEVPPHALVSVLGPGYNDRYMSITHPGDEEEDKRDGVNGANKRHTPSFYVEDPNYVREFAEQPAWENSSHMNWIPDEDLSPRMKRSNAAPLTNEHWTCQDRFVWTDLGQDYFPRYLRDLECDNRYCWYGRYRCKPKAFPLRFLKRKRNKCVEPAPGTTLGQWDLPYELLELWVWEERAVNFCCTCSL